MRTKENIKSHELIGCNIRVIESKNKSAVNIKGKIIDETKNTLHIKTEKDTKKVFKNNCMFEISIPETLEKIKIKGEEISLQPEKRMKQKKAKKKRA